MLTPTNATRPCKPARKLRLRTLLASGATAVFGVLSACTGQIGGSDGVGPAGGPGGPAGGVGGPGGKVGPDGKPALVEASDPGHATIRRLNNVEYNNTVRDLLGTKQRPADIFSADVPGHGFDNVSDAQAIALTQVEQYATAAESLAREVLGGPNRAKVVTCDPAKEAAACVRRIITDFGLRAFRRPLTDTEVASYTKIYDLGSRQASQPDAGLQSVLEAMLISPNFLFMVEVDPAPQATEPHALGNYELATRLSHFLWSSTPDRDLLQAAATESLSRPEGWSAQVSRMLDDPHSEALADNFAGQWFLWSRKLPLHDVQADVFPTWTPDLLRSMQQESALMFREFMANAQSPLLGLLTSSYTFVDAPLAQHYGLTTRFNAAQPIVAGSPFRRIDLSDTPRRGILGQASLLTATSVPDRTSPTKRGVFVLSELLCSPPNPPPPNIPPLPPADNGSAAGKTVGERLAEHAKPGTVCFGCHSVFDPIGLSFEQFDGLGRFREQEDGKAIVTAGKLQDGTQFAGPTDLIPLIAKDERAQRCAVEKLATYALGRQVESERVDYLNQEWQATGGTFRDLVRVIATSRAFQMRRGDSLPPDSTTPGGAL